MSDKSVNTAKCLSAVSLAVFRLSFARVPIEINNILNGRNKKVLDDAEFRKRLERFDFFRVILRSFGSGVFLCACLVHLMPEVVQLLCDGYKKSSITKDDGVISALAQLYICIGFFIIYFVEEFCHWLLTKVPTIPVSSLNKRTAAEKPQMVIHKEESGDMDETTETSGDTVVSYMDNNEQIKKKKKLSETYTSVMNSIKERSSVPHVEDGNLKNGEERNNPSKRQFLGFVFSGTGVVLHAFFEGIAIGLQHESSNVWFLTIAMMIHSATTLFCVGMKFLAMRTGTKSIIVHFIIQALAIPAGILVGYSILVEGKLDQTLLIDGYFEALSTGTILYITFFESLSKEKQMRVLRVCRSVSMLLGFGLMCLLEYFVFLEKSVLREQYTEMQYWGNQGDVSTES